ncbi:hypothetical protein [Picosynechococcus sp. NKBG042902]|uniref:hypothetical protein n=1 Tax=Picosynechococcus sp. NKBG042902 TaxID=490193 RepID=UPI0004ABA234|nr:hypothetical protein [Picosynechococcus sp. NKBG042902]
MQEKHFSYRNICKKKKSNLSFRAYSYISLFGIKDIDSLRHQIFINFEPLKEEDLASKSLNIVKPFLDSLKDINVPHFRSLSLVNNLIENKFVENFLICFDDLERKEKHISGASILGLISQLKEEKKCKIILIYNDQELDSETEEQINEYREKVVDLDLTYQPYIDENLSIIWPQNCPKQAINIFQKLNLNNIRIMQRVKWTLDYFGQVMSQYEYLRNSFEHKCIILTILHHAYSSKLISLQELQSINFYSILMSEEENEVITFLKKINYFPEEQDEIIINYLLNGYVNIDEFQKLLTTKNEQYKSSDIRIEYEKNWEKFNSTFTTSQEDFIKAQVDFLKKHIDYLGIIQVASIIQIIQELDPSIDLNNFLEKSIDLYAKKSEDAPDFTSLNLLGIPEEILVKIKKKISEREFNYPIRDLFISLAGNNSWNPSEIKYFANFSEDDLYEWITTESSLDVIGLVRKFLERFTGKNDEEKDILKKLKSALNKIKVRSDIDRLRIKYLILEKNLE